MATRGVICAAVFRWDNFYDLKNVSYTIPDMFAFSIKCHKYTSLFTTNDSTNINAT